jgi:FkbM family methyltransferase
MRSLFRKAAPQPAPSAPPAPPTPNAEWRRTFAEVFGKEPTENQQAHLDWLAAGEPGATPHRRYRAVLAGFDQQDIRTGFTVRWGKDDVRLKPVHGFSMYLDRADISVARSVESGAYEPHLVAFFDAFLSPGMHVVDAGANIGLYSLLAASRVGAQGKVVSFEPNSENCRLLVASAAANGFDNIALHPVALGNTVGWAHFTMAIGSNGGLQDDRNRDILDESCRIVPVMRLDDFALPRIDLMKMDVEGAEALLVEGAQETLRRCRPVVVAEFSHEMLGRVARRDPTQFLEGLQAQGFELFMSDKVTHRIRPLGDVREFVAPFVGTGRIEDLVFCPAEKVATLPLRE